VAPEVDSAGTEVDRDASEVCRVVPQLEMVAGSDHWCIERGLRG
jgi:hypothetical protein